MEVTPILELNRHTSPSNFVALGDFIYTLFKHFNHDWHINVYKLSTKEQIFSAKCPFPDNANNVHIYEEDGKVKAFILDRLTNCMAWMYSYLLVFDFDAHTLRTQMEKKHEIQDNILATRWLSGNVFAMQLTAESISIFSPGIEEPRTYRYCYTNFASFRHNDFFVQLDHTCQYAVLSHVVHGGIKTEKIRHQGGVQLSLGHYDRQAFVFEDTVLIIDTDCHWKNGKMIMLMLSTWELYDVTDQVKLPEMSVIEVARQNKEAIYLYTQDYKMFKIQVTGRDLRFLPKEESVGNGEKSLEHTVDTICPVCFEPFTIPKILTKCGHSICEACEVALTVDPGLNLDKTLTCPVCRVVTNLPSTEVLPTNWSLKSLAGKVGSLKISSMTCHSCNHSLTSDRIFECSKCQSDRDGHQVLICGACAIEKHSDHVFDVSKVTFIDTKTVTDSLARVGLPTIHPSKEEANAQELASEVSKKLSLYDERARRTIEKIKQCSMVTQKSLDKCVEELALIKANIEEGTAVLKQTSEMMKHFLSKCLP
uniref:RING-type domain-containing protein n=1 Tax=Steinernema glaseri TaxID=37863 RepID=A0A1I8AV90_9BILA